MCLSDIAEHSQRGSNLDSSTLCYHAVIAIALDNWAHASCGLKSSPLASTAQVMRAFFAAIAMTAFQ